MQPTRFFNLKDRGAAWLELLGRTKLAVEGLTLSIDSIVEGAEWRHCNHTPFRWDVCAQLKLANIAFFCNEEIYSCVTHCKHNLCYRRYPLIEIIPGNPIKAFYYSHIQQGLSTCLLLKRTRNCCGNSDIRPPPHPPFANIYSVIYICFIHSFRLFLSKHIFHFVRIDILIFSFTQHTHTQTHSNALPRIHLIQSIKVYFATKR